MKRVLLVEDNRTNRKLMGDHLRRAGYDLVEAETADEALALALHTPVDLVVMDIQLPGTDGLTAARLLRANAKTEHVPVLAVTAHRDPGALEAGPGEDVLHAVAREHSQGQQPLPITDKMSPL